MWLYALGQLGEIKPEYREGAIALARDIHSAFVVPGVGVIWKMKEDLRGPYPGYGLGAMDTFDGYVAYRLLDSAALAPEIAQMRDLIDRDAENLDIDQDLGLGMMLWLAHFFPDEAWAKLQHGRTLAVLDAMWVDPPGYFCRARRARGRSSSHSPITASRSGNEYDTEAITHVMACTSHFPGAFISGAETSGDIWRDGIRNPPRAY
jgi:hypothetical protein